MTFGIGAAGSSRMVSRPSVFALHSCAAVAGFAPLLCGSAISGSRVDNEAGVIPRNTRRIHEMTAYGTSLRSPCLRLNHAARECGGTVLEPERRPAGSLEASYTREFRAFFERAGKRSRPLCRLTRFHGLDVSYTCARAYTRACARGCITSCYLVNGSQIPGSMSAGLLSSGR
jgi:hypothetical protein